MILKVQVSIFSTHGTAMALIYNEDRSFVLEFRASERLLKKMGDEPKRFFEAEVSQDGGVSLISLAPDPGW
jgi:hypothetical protein